MMNYDTAALLRLFDMLVQDDPNLRHQLLLACSQPATYVIQHQDRLSWRGINKPIPKLPWIVFVNLLEDCGRLVELDWRAAPEDVQWALNKLLAKHIDTDTWWSWFQSED